MPKYDEAVDLIVTNYRPGVLTVWERNPDEAGGLLYGVPYSQMPAPTKAAAESQLSKPPAAPPASYGSCSQRIFVETLYKGNPILIRAATQYGPVRIKNVSQTLSGNGGTLRVDVTIGDGTTNCAVADGNLGTQYGEPPWDLSQVSFRYTVSGSNTPISPNPGGGYPPLTEGEKKTLGDYLAGFKAVNFYYGIGQTAQIASLQQEVAQVRTKVDPLEPKINDLRKVVDTIPPLQTETETELERVKAIVTDILACTCQLTIKDCNEQTDIIGIKNILQKILYDLCDVSKATGLIPGGLLVETNSPKRYSNLATMLADLLFRIEFSSPPVGTLCGEDEVVANLEAAWSITYRSLGFGLGIPLDPLPDGTGQTACTVRDGLAEVINNPGPDSYYFGFEGNRPPQSILKIRYDVAGRNRGLVQMQIPAPVSTIGAEQILEALPQRTVGDWLCMVTLSNGYRMYSWFPSKEEGLPYMIRAAGLSSLELIDGSEAATYNPSKSPKNGQGIMVTPCTARIIYPDGSNLKPLRIRLR